MAEKIVNTVQRVGLYPGTFDPFTNGHHEIVDESLRLFDRVIIAVGQGGAKSQTLFTVDERVNAITEIYQHEKRVMVLEFSGLVVDFARAQGAHALIRGLRSEADFSYEMPMAIANRKLNPTLMTVFIPANINSHFVSSSLVREVAMNGGDVSLFVPTIFADMLRKKVARS